MESIAGLLNAMNLQVVEMKMVEFDETISMLWLIAQYMAAGWWEKMNDVARKW